MIYKELVHVQSWRQYMSAVGGLHLGQSSSDLFSSHSNIEVLLALVYNE